MFGVCSMSADGRTVKPFLKRMRGCVSAVQWKGSLARAFYKILYKFAMAERARSILDYLGPSFSNILGPCSCHSCFVIHMFSLSAICRLSAAERDCAPRISRLTYNVCKHCATKEDHMSPPWWILNPDLEFLGTRVSIVVVCIAFGDSHSASQGSHPAPLSATAA